MQTNIFKSIAVRPNMQQRQAPLHIPVILSAPLFIDRVCCACPVTSVMSNSLRPYRLWPTSLLCPWDSPGKNTGVGCQALLQKILPIQGSNHISYMSLALAGGFFTTSTTWEAHYYLQSYKMLNFKNQEICYVLIT